MSRARVRAIPAILLLVVMQAARPAAAVPTPTRIGDLTIRAGDVPRRLVGYGLVVGLEGTGDHSFGGLSTGSPTVRSVVNLLRRFSIEVPADRLRLRNVAAVLVTAEVSPFLRAGGRFEVQVAALGDATSLRGGVLWITPLVSDPNQPPTATAQGPVYVPDDDSSLASYMRRGNAGHIPQGGVLEADPPLATAVQSKLLLRDPDLGTANRIAEAINSAMGDGTAKVEDPGAVALVAGKDHADNISGFLAAVDTLSIRFEGPARIVISQRDGTIVAGGDARIGPAVVSHQGITLQIGGAAPASGAPPQGLVRMEPQASVEDVAAGLHAAGAKPPEVAAIFEALQAAGALNARVVIR